MTNASEGEEPRETQDEFPWAEETTEKSVVEPAKSIGDVTLAYYARRDEQMLQSKKALKETCAILFKAGITRVKVKYEGSGDNGCIEQVSFFKDKHLLSGKEVDSLDLLTSTTDKTVECSIEARVEDCALGFLPGGFGNDSGSFGDLIINTEKAIATRMHNDRFESSEYSEVRYDLTSKEVPGERARDRLTGRVGGNHGSSVSSLRK